MPYKVLLTAGAERDLEALHDHIAHHDSKASADRLLDKLLKAAERGGKIPSSREVILRSLKKTFDKVFR